MLTVVIALWTTRVETVYNFGVDGYHTYFVGEVGAWVHNCTVTNTGGSAAAKGTAIRRVGDLLESAQAVVANPSLLGNKSVAEVRMTIGNTPSWIDDVMRHSKTHPQGGWVFREMNAGTDFTGDMIQFHPGTPRHFNGSAYWKVSSGKRGTVRIPVNH